MSTAINRSLLAVLVLASSTLLGAATIDATSNWAIVVNPDPITAGASVSISVKGAAEYPVEVQFRVNGSLIGTAILDDADAVTTFPVAAGTAGQSWKATCNSSSGSLARTGVIVP